MKFKKLTIHNIASITDATIDFEAEPLRDAPLFLIAGPTGAGKTTILDSICLALYGRLPRMGMEGNNSPRSDRGADRRLAPTDPRQMLRTGTGEGWATLEFADTKGDVYRATWSVQRAHKKPTGKMQETQRTLESLTNPANFYRGKTQVQEAVGRIVQLDSTQFVRTTMLAQGEFTRFLKSDDREKAEILEKITDRPIFTEVGREIADILTEKNNALAAAQAQLGNVVLLSDKEIGELKQQISVSEEKTRQWKTESDALQQKSTWLTTEADLTTKLAETRQKEAEAQAVLASDTYREKANTLAQLEVSADARNAMGREAEARAELDRAGQEKQRLRERYAHALAGIRALETDIAAKSSSKEEKNRQLEAMAPQAVLLQRADEVKVALTQLQGARDNVVKASEEIDRKSADLRKKQADYYTSKEKVDAMAVTHDALGKELKRMRDAAEGYDTKSLSSQATDAANRANTLGNLKKAIDTFLKDTAQHIKKDNDLLKEQSELKALADSLPALTRERDEAQKEVERQDTLYQTMEKTRDDTVAELRQGLSVGCRCPVCLQEVDRLLDPEKIVPSAMISQAKEQLEEAKADYETKNKFLITRQTTVDEQKKELTRRSAELEKISAELAQTREKLRQEVVKEGVVEEALEHPDLLDTPIAGAQRRQETAKKEIAKANDALKKVNDKQKEVDTSLRALNKAKEKLGKKQQQLNTLTTQIKSLHEQVEREEKKAADTLASLLATPGVDAWGFGEFADAQAAQTMLRDGQTAYHALVSETTKLTTALAAAQKDRNNLLTLQRRLLAIVPDFASAQPSDTAPLKPVDETLTQLISDTSALGTRRHDALGKGVEANAAISAFLSSHPGITADRLAELAALTFQAVKRLAQEKKEADEASVGASRAVLTVGQQLAEHSQKRPDLLPDDTVETLRERQTATDSLLAAENQKIGEQKARLNQATDDRRKFDELSRQRDLCAQEVQRWKAFADVFGDKDGNRFRKIAQSFLLAELIRKANVYLRSLSGRYTMNVVSGTFNIDVVDAAQAHTERPSTTSSGGETFMVSLALALALSDISERIGADILFIDEGFGSLSSEPLDKSISLLQSLHTTLGRRVGIISHIQELSEPTRIPVQIRVQADPSTGASRLTLLP